MLVRKIYSSFLFGIICIIAAGMGLLASWFFYSDPEVIYWISGILGFLLLVYLLIWKFNYFVASFVFLIPLSVPIEASGNALSFPSEALLGLMTLLLILRTVFVSLPEKKVLFHPIGLVLIADLLWFFVSSAMSDLPEVAFKRSLMRTLFITVFYFMIIPFFKQERNILLFFMAYGTGMIIPIINTLLNHSVHYFVMRAAFFVTEPFYVDHTLYGACLSFTIVALAGLFIIYRKGFNLNQQYFWPLLIGFLCVADFFAFSRAAWASLAGMLVLLALFRLRIPRTVLLTGGLAAALLISFNFNSVLDQFRGNFAVSTKSEDVAEHIQSLTNVSTDVSNTERVNRWVSAVNMFKARPFFGFGPGTYQFEYGIYQDPQYKTRISTDIGDKGNAHSEYLGVLSENGWPGLFFLVLLIGVSFNRGLKLNYARRDRREAKIVLVVLLGLSTYFLHGLVNCFIDQDKAAVLVFGSLAVITAMDIKLGQQSK